MGEVVGPARRPFAGRRGQEGLGEVAGVEEAQRLGRAADRRRPPALREAGQEQEGCVARAVNRGRTKDCPGRPPRLRLEQRLAPKLAQAVGTDGRVRILLAAGPAADGQGQLAYYARKEAQNNARYRRTSLLGRVCLWSGIGVAILLLLGDAAGTAEWRRPMLVLMGVLPLIAGVWDAYSHKRADKELIKQYAFMSGVFRKARKLLDGSRDVEFRRRVLKALGQAALEESGEWLLMHRERPLEHGKL